MAKRKTKAPDPSPIDQTQAGPYPVSHQARVAAEAYVSDPLTQAGPYPAHRRFNFPHAQEASDEVA
jgi:hypothetical protein